MIEIKYIIYIFFFYYWDRIGRRKKKKKKSTFFVVDGSNGKKRKEAYLLNDYNVFWPGHERKIHRSSAEDEPFENKINARKNR